MVKAMRAVGFPGRRKDIKRFLVISTTGAGDTLMGVPAIRALKETYPDCHVGVLANPAGAELLRGNPAIDDIHIFRRGIKGFIGLPFLIYSLWANKFSSAFILHSSDRTVWLLAFLSGANTIVGTDLDNRGLDSILTNVIPHPDVHGIEMRLKIVETAGATTTNKEIDMFLNDADLSEAESFLNSSGMKQNDMIIGIHPGAKDAFKCWPSERFIEAGNQLKIKYNSKIIITGGPGESRLADSVCKGIKGSVSAAGKLSVRGTAALIKMMNLYVSNDTGPMHMAFAVKTPTVALFAPTDSRLSGPHLARNAVAIQRPATCSPCLWKKCPSPRCMDQITVDDVIRASEYLLNRSAE